MNRSEEVRHLRSHFRQSDDAGKLELVLVLRDKAIEQLGRGKEKIPRPMSDRERKMYQTKSFSTEWNLTDYDDATTFGLLVRTRDTSLSPSQKSAAALLTHCAKALRLNAVPDHLRDWILDAYAGLDFDTTKDGDTWIKNQRASGFKRFEEDQERHDNWRRWQQCEMAANPKFGEYSKQEQARRLKKKHDIASAVATIAKRLNPQPKG